MADRSVAQSELDNSGLGILPFFSMELGEEFAEDEVREAIRRGIPPCEIERKLDQREASEQRSFLGRFIDWWRA